MTTRRYILFTWVKVCAHEVCEDEEMIRAPLEANLDTSLTKPVPH